MHISICLITSSFDIGGAETHILTLAEALSRMGHRVTVVSGGGAYAGRAGDAFRHITIPLMRKRSMLRALRALSLLFKRESFDVIHVHTRYTAFLCRLLGVRFVSTAHWVFSLRFPLKQLSFWGERCLAVSEDIASYLEAGYRFPRERITVTVNGIDSLRYRSGKKETAGCVHITLCSRLDADRSAAAFALLEAADLLRDRFFFSLRIVGDGEDLLALRRRASEINRRAGRPVVRCTGASDTVEAVLADTDIFVGVSRAALEAMAAECAVILAGNEGYLSIFSPAHAEAAEQTNFCCRGARQTSCEALVHDLSLLLSLSPTRRHEMGKENRAYVKRKYSAERMAKDALWVYERVLKKKAILCGYYGFGNVGDELMHKSLLARLSREGYQRIYTFSARRLSLSSLYALWQGYDLFLGGGNLLQNETSMRSLRFYATVVRWARRRGSTVRMLSSGFGELDERGREVAAHAVNACQSVECRTSGDLALARMLGASRAVLSHDAVLDLPLGLRKEDAGRVLLALRAPSAEDTLSFRALLSRLSHLYGRERLLLFSMHPNDTRALRREARFFRIDFCGGTYEEFLRALRSSRIVYAARLHAAVCALRVGVPCLLSDEEEKSRFFAADVCHASEALALPSPIALFSPTGRLPPEPCARRLSALRVCEALRGRI